MSVCNCGCGNETGSHEFYKLHVEMSDLDRYALAILEYSLAPNDELEKELESLKAEIQGLIEKGTRWNKAYIMTCIDNPVLRGKIFDLEYQLKGEKLLSEKRRSDGIEMMLEIAKLKKYEKILTGSHEIFKKENTKLKEEQGMMFNHRGVIAKLREKDGFNLSMIAKLKEGIGFEKNLNLCLKHDRDNLKSTLDEIKKLDLSKVKRFTGTKSGDSNEEHNEIVNTLQRLLDEGK